MLRFKNRAQFQAALAQRVVAKTEHFALHRHPLGRAERTDASPPPSGSTVQESPSVSPSAAPAPLFSPVGLWLGAMVPKRWAKRSVTRHAIKRQIHAVAEAMLPGQDQAAYLVRLRSGFSREQFHSSSSELLKQAVRDELTRLMARLPRPVLP